MRVLAGMVVSADVTSLARVVGLAAGAMATAADTLNEADARLGDGDTGLMLARLFEAMARVDLSAETDLGAACQKLARAGATATGSSLGTLIATALLACGRALKGRNAVEPADVAALLDDALNAMMARGGAAIGDKTVLDSIAAAAREAKGAASWQEVRDRLAGAAIGALDALRDRPNQVGRARMFGDRTIGIDDPGMLAFATLARHLQAAGGR